MPITDVSLPTTHDSAVTTGSTLPSHEESVDMRMSPFAPSCIRVLCLRAGHPSYTPATKPVEFTFELSAEEMKEISRWSDQSPG